MRTTGRAEFKDVLFLHGWERVHVSQLLRLFPDVCCLSLSPFFHLPPPKALRALLHPSSAPPHPVCHQLWAQTGRACCKAVKAAPLQFAAGLHRCSTHKLPLGVSPLPPVWAPGGLPGPPRRRGSRTLSLLRSPGALVSLQDLTADTHGFDNKERE